MLLPFVAIIVVFLSLTPPSCARQWYDVHFATSPPDPPSQYFFELSGQLVVPRLPRAGIYYIFPAMQPVSGGGISQTVLDGRSGKWWIADGWWSAKWSQWGPGFNCYHKDLVTFHRRWERPGDHNAPWINTIKHDSTGTTKVTKFPLGSKFFNQVLFAIEIYHQQWDFGWVEFKNIVIKSSGTDTKWCYTPISDTTHFINTPPIATVDKYGVTCTIAALTLMQPSHPQPP